MSETQLTPVISIKGRIAELGPSLQHAPAGWVYLGRINKRGKNHGGWDLDGSPYANPYSVARYGPDEAYARFREYFLGRPDLIDRAVHELARATAYLCWCADLSRCHASFVAAVLGGRVAGPTLTVGPERTVRHTGRTAPLRVRETVRPVGEWAGAL